MSIYTADITTTDPIEIVRSCARNAAVDWFDQRPKGEYPSQWRDAVPDADVDYIQQEVLGRPMTDDECEVCTRAFRERYNELADSVAEALEGWDDGEGNEHVAGRWS